VPQLLITAIRSISLGDLFLKLYEIRQGRKIIAMLEGIEDGGVLRKVAIVGVVQRIFDEISNKHLDATRGRGTAIEVFCSNKVILCMIRVRRIKEGDSVIVPPVWDRRKLSAC
jgi:hypothetical protein